MNESRRSFRHFDLNGIRIHAAEDGPENGPLVILLHGFPEYWYGWRHQIPFLASHGYRIVAPDQRGYNLSSKPEAVGSYNIDLLTQDAVALVDALAYKEAVLIGHDWGGIVAWRAANRYPDRWKKLIIINCPHPTVMRRTLRKSWKQKRKSWYMFLFQIPRLPEFLLSAANFHMLARTLRRTSLPGTFNEAELALYRQAWSQPGSIRSAIHWYRALVQTKPERLPSPQIKVPTLLIWGTRDRFLGSEMAQPSIDLCDSGRLEFMDDATHWVHLEAPDRVNASIVSFLRR